MQTSEQMDNTQLERCFYFGGIMEHIFLETNDFDELMESIDFIQQPSDPDPEDLLEEVVVSAK